MFEFSTRDGLETSNYQAGLIPSCSIGFRFCFEHPPAQQGAAVGANLRDIKCCVRNKGGDFGVNCKLPVISSADGISQSVKMLAAPSVQTPTAPSPRFLRTASRSP